MTLPFIMRSTSLPPPCSVDVTIVAVGLSRFHALGLARDLDQ